MLLRCPWYNSLASFSFCRVVAAVAAESTGLGLGVGVATAATPAALLAAASGAGAEDAWRCCRSMAKRSRASVAAAVGAGACGSARGTSCCWCRGGGRCGAARRALAASSSASFSAARSACRCFCKIANRPRIALHSSHRSAS